MLRFHLASGVRLAQRAFVPLAGALVVGVGVSQDPAATMRSIAAAVAAPRLSGGVIFALLAAGGAIASWAAPRLAFSTSGWIRHLPASAVAHRRAAALALAAAQLPLVVGVTGLVALAATTGTPVAAMRLPAVAVAAVAIGAARAPARRPSAGLALGLAAAVAALAFGTAGFLAAAAILVVSDRLGGAPAAKPSPVRVATASRLPLPLAESLALGVAAPALPAALLLAAVPLAAGYALVHNNPDLPPLLGGRGARLAGALAVAVVVARASDRLALLRPPWPWVRSLPWTARRRVLADVIVLAVLAAPCALATAGMHGPAVGAVVGAAVPLVAARGASAIRRGHDAASPPSGALLAEGAFIAALIALVPWLGLVALAAVPWAAADAARRERGLRVSRWAALHHLAAGDPLSWRTR